MRPIRALARHTGKRSALFPVRGACNAALVQRARMLSHDDLGTGQFEPSGCQRLGAAAMVVTQAPDAARPLRPLNQFACRRWRSWQSCPSLLFIMAPRCERLIHQDPLGADSGDHSTFEDGLHTSAYLVRIPGSATRFIIHRNMAEPFWDGRAAIIKAGLYSLT